MKANFWVLSLLAVSGGMGGVFVRFLVFTLFKFLSLSSFYATFVVNMIASFLIGMIFSFQLPPHMNTFLITGILGGLSTFSTWILDIYSLYQGNRYYVLFFYILLHIFVGLLLFFFGIKTAISLDMSKK